MSASAAAPARGVRRGARLALTRTTAVYLAAAAVQSLLLLASREYVAPAELAMGLALVVVLLAAVTIPAITGRWIRLGNLVPALAVLMLALGDAGFGDRGDLSTPGYLSLVPPAVGGVALALGRAPALGALGVICAAAVAARGGLPLVWDEAAILQYRGLGVAIFLTVITGFAMVLVVSLVERAATRADQELRRSLEDYRTAVHDEAAEAERSRIDALVHDRVLSTFLAAARAEDDDGRRLATEMAAEAVLTLRSAVRPTRAARVLAGDELVAAGADLIVAIRGLDPHLSVAMPAPEQLRAVSVPAAVVDACHAACVQAAVNSIEHAGPDASRWLVLRIRGDDALELEFGDDGVGFDPSERRPGSLGVRLSIVDRLEAVGGTARILAAPGRGVRVQLRWDASDLEEEELETLLARLRMVREGDQPTRSRR